MKLLTKHSPFSVCLAAALLFFYSFFQLTMFNSISSPLMQSFAISPTTLGYLSASFFLANAIATIPAGLLLDRFSVRHLALFVMGLCAISTLIFSFTHSLSVAFICRMLNGLGNTFGFLASMQMAARWLPTKRLALGIGLIITFIMLGGIVAQTPFVLLVSHTNWRIATCISGIIGLGFFSFMWFYLQDFPIDKIPSQHHNNSVIKNLICVLKNKQNWLCALFTALINQPIYLLGALWGVLYLEQAQQISAHVAGNIAGMLFLGMILGSTCMGWISDLIHNRKLIMQISAIFSAILILIMMLHQFAHPGYLVVIFFCLGFLSSSQNMSYPIITENNPIEMNGTAMALVGMVMNISGFIAQPLFGWIMQLGHTKNTLTFMASDYNYAMIILVVAFLLSAVLANRIKHKIE